MANLRLNRQQLAQFLPNHEAIKAFEALFNNVQDSIPSSLDDVQSTADSAQLQAAEALSGLAQVANALSLALYGAYSEVVTPDNYVQISEQAQQDIYVPPNSFGSIAEQNANKVAITGGAIDNTSIGLTTAAAAAFTTLAASGLFSANGGQIKFPAAQNPSADVNTLDDYEEGTFTPSYTPATGAFGSITVTATGRYVKFGKNVFVWIDIRTTAATTLGTAAGNLYVSGLPFAADANGGFGNVGIAQLWNLGVSVNGLGAIVEASGSRIYLTKNASNAGAAYVQATEVLTSAGGFNNLLGIFAAYQAAN